MKFIEVEYNQDLKPLETLLSAVKRPGDFFARGAIEMPMPRVEVEGAGTLSLPVPDSQIATLIRQAERAPYGRGNETVVDTAVRKVWQIASAKVRIGGKSWATNFETILSKVSAGLGCEGVAVVAELYKLLLYDRHGFFLPHRDTEKADGMFGTLVITLSRLIAAANCGFDMAAAKSLWIPAAPNSPNFLTWRFTRTANTRRCPCRKETVFVWFTT